MQVRIGDLDVKGYPRRQITYNTVCGGNLPVRGNRFPFTSFLCESPLTGRYLTIQMLSKIHMELAEVEVYTASKCDIIVPKSTMFTCSFCLSCSNSQERL